MTTAALAQLAGGFGLFLLALGMMTDGLKLAAGSRLKTILEWGTTPAWRGLLSGILITALVQASGAVTIAAIGFVNAGLMTLGQSLAVIFGTNIGTTVTGWLVSLVGIEFDIAALALPMVGAGMVLKMVGGGRSFGGVGWALAGFGLFFLGLDFLQDGFSAMSSGTPFGIVAERGIVGVLIGLGVGLVITVLAQSSSAALALVLTAAQSGVLLIPSAAAMVIGANIGTTSTALFATIGATPNAKRVALAHVLFNVLTGAVALGLLVAALEMGVVERAVNGMAPAAFLALFHSAFNVMGVALIWPVRERLARFLSRRFRSAEEDLARPVYLDPNLARVPALGGMALLNEITRMAALTQEAVTAALRGPEGAIQPFTSRHDAVQRLVFEAGHYAARIQQGAMGEQQSRALAECVRVAQYFAEAVEIAQRLRGLGDRLAAASARAGLASPAEFVEDWLALIQSAAPGGPMDGRVTPGEDRIDQVEADYHAMRQRLIDASIQGRLHPEDLSACLEGLAEMNRLMKRLTKAGRLYRSVAHAFADGPLPSVTPAALD